MRRAFTLLELLVTLTILSLVLTALYGTLVGTIETRNQIDKLTEGPREGLALIEILSADFRGAVLPPVTKAPFYAKADKSGEGRDKDQVTFIASVTSRFTEDPRTLRGEQLLGIEADGDADVEPVRADICEVSYYLKPDPDHPGRMRLYRREDFHVDPQMRSGGIYLLLHRRVAGLKLRYFRGDEAESGREPQENWDAEKTGTVPQAVLIELTLDVTPAEDEDDKGTREPILKTYTTVVPVFAGRLPKDPDG